MKLVMSKSNIQVRLNSEDQRLLSQQITKPQRRDTSLKEGEHSSYPHNWENSTEDSWGGGEGTVIAFDQ